MDAGHFQFQANLVSFSMDRWNADGKYFGVNVADFNLEGRLYNNLDCSWL